MTVAHLKRGSLETAPDVEENQPLQVSAGRRAADAVEIARSRATTIVEGVPGTLRATRAGARGATTALQALPDSTLRWLTAASVGLAAGLTLAGAPRLVRAAGAVPALLMGAAIALRTTEPGIAAHHHATESAEGVFDMTDEHTKGAISTTEGKVEEGLGKLTGDKEQQAHGKAKQVQGAAQKGLGDVQDAVRGSKDKS